MALLFYSLKVDAMLSFIRAKLKRHVPDDLKRNVRENLAKYGIGRLPQHPYPEQFSSEMDCPERDWPERFVLIASTPRCGSHYLGHMLGATGECGVPLEYFNKGNKRYWVRRFRKTRMDELFPKFVQHRTSPNGTFTLKAHWYQYEPYIDSLDRLTRGLGFEKVVWISRRSQLSQAVSKVIAEQTGVWVSGAKPKAEAKFDYDAIVSSAVSIRRFNLLWLDYINALPPGRCIAVLYEDLQSDEPVRDKLAEFLELETKLKSPDPTRKQGGDINASWKRRFVDEVRDEDRWILDPPSWLAQSQVPPPCAVKAEPNEVRSRGQK